MDGLGQFLSGLFSRPRLTWAALGLAAGSFLLVPPQSIGIQSDEVLSWARVSAWALLLLASAFLAITVAIDIGQAATKQMRKNADTFGMALRFHSLPEDAKALLKYLAINSENCVWIHSEHPGIYPLRSSQFLYVSSNQGDVLELETRNGVFEWLQRELDTVTDVVISEHVKARLLAAIRAGQDSRHHSWMA